MALERNRCRRRQPVRVRPILEALEARTLMTVSIDPLASIYGPKITLPAGKAIVVPLTGNNTLTGKVTYTVTSNNAKLIPIVNSFRPVVRRTTIRMSTSLGDMDFQLFNDVAPRAVNYLLNHLSDPDYVNSIFHRIIKANLPTDLSIIQGGDRDGDGLGSNSPSFIETELDTRLMFTGHGQLGLARKSLPDTGDTQFFVTLEQQRGFDYGYTIYGQLLRGFDVLTALNSVPTDANDRPLTPPTLTGISVIPNKTDAVMTILSTSKTPLNGRLTVTARDAFGHRAVRFINVSTVTDTENNPPFIVRPPSKVNRLIKKNATTTVTYGGIFDLEGDAATISGSFIDNPSHFTATFNAARTAINITPETGYSGPINVLIEATQANNSFNKTGRLYQFTVDAGLAPTVSSSLHNVTGRPRPAYFFRVTYTDDYALNSTTIVNNDSLVNVITPGGSFLPAQYVNSTVNGKTRTVVYKVTAPGGSWNPADTGTYTVRLRGATLKDTMGNTTAAQNMGTFTYSPT
jgi:peptidyl-prolyl cis-trans isomerase B (cyclophilin B)